MRQRWTHTPRIFQFAYTEIYIYTVLQWGQSRDGELLKKYSQKPNY